MKALQPNVAIDPYVVVTIPRALEASARLALAGLYQPFFMEWAREAVVLITRAVEWEHVAPRFPGASAQGGFRLISLGLPPGDAPEAGEGPDPPAPPPAIDLSALVGALEQRGIRARPLRSFYRDHLLVAEEDLAACLEALAGFPESKADSSSGG